MRPLHVHSVLAFCGGLLVAASTAPAQQVTVGTPFHSLSDSYFERIGVNWGFNWKGISASFGSPNMAAPQFGGFDPSAGINTGFGFQGRHGSGYLNFGAAQGFRRSLVSQTPSVTLTNGCPGFVADASQRPFVIGYIPVVGDYSLVPYPFASAYPGVYMESPNAIMQPETTGNPRVQAMRRQLADAQRAGVAKPLQPPAAKDLDLHPPAEPPVVDHPDGPAEKMAAAQASTAGRPAPSVAEARRLHQLEKTAENTEAMVLFERGLAAEEAGKGGAAKVYYRMALKRAAGEFRSQVQARLDALSSPGTP